MVWEMHSLQFLVDGMELKFQGLFFFQSMDSCVDAGITTIEHCAVAIIRGASSVSGFNTEADCLTVIVRSTPCGESR